MRTVVSNPRCRRIAPINLLTLLERKWVLINWTLANLLHRDDQIEDAKPLVHLAFGPSTQREVSVNEFNPECVRPVFTLLGGELAFYRVFLRNVAVGLLMLVFSVVLHEGLCVGQHGHRQQVLQEKGTHLRLLPILLNVELARAKDDPEKP